MLAKDSLRIDGNMNESVVGWTEDGTVVWMYRTIDGGLTVMEMSPTVARKCAKNFTALDGDIRESLNDCSYSASRYGDVDEDLCRRSVINPRENPNIKTFGISVSWENFNKIKGEKGYPTYEISKPS